MRTQRPATGRDASSPFARFTAVCAETSGIVLHADAERGLTYIWHAASPDPIDEGPRESGLETSALTVLHDATGECVAYLRISYSTEEMLTTTFSRLLEWAEESRGWRMGFGAAKHGYGPPLTPQRLWQQAHLHANQTPASLLAADRYVSPWSLTDKDVPADPAVLEADLVAIEDTLRPVYDRWLSFTHVPFVAYAETRSDNRGQVSYRRTGVGRIMYTLAAQQLAVNGRILRASGNQSTEAEAFWASLVADPDVPTTTVTVPNWVSGEESTHVALDYR